MREIKFRAWDGKALSQGWTLKMVSDYGEQWFKTAQAIMQFTGLHDKNGKEIYEGDILKDGYENRIVGAIEWSWNGFQLPAPYDITNYTPDHELEVIGNIYEHSHLLSR